MKKNLKIFCTSSLAPAGSFWSALKKNYKIDFEEFLDINDIKIKKKLDEINYFIIFVEDLTQNFNNQAHNARLIKNYFNNLNRISKKNNSTNIISIFSRDESHPINFAKYENPKSIFLNKINNYLFSKTKKSNNFFYLNTNTLFDKVGHDAVYDTRNWYSFRLRVNQKGMNIIIAHLRDLLDKLNKPRKKVLLLDCDNTLWGGVVGEDGVEKLKIGTDGEGKAFRDFQNTLKSISETGILLCLTSKNNENDVWDVFNHHPEMILKKKDITTSYINWDDKVENIKKISKKLNLGLDSFVFIDDNPLERDLVKKFLPQVEVLQMPDDISFWSDYLKQLTLFSNFGKTSEDSKKKIQYEEKLKFDDDLKNTKNKKKFLKKINLKIKVEKLNRYHYSRASQMTLKTNQFNFTSRRYSIGEISKFNNDKKNMTFILNLRDYYGEHGFVSLIMLTKIKNNFIITNFLTSCRVLGRDVEKIFLNQIIKKIVKKKNKLFIEFIPTTQNNLAKKFIIENKFKILNKKEKQKLNLNQRSNFYLLN